MFIVVGGDRPLVNVQAIGLVYPPYIACVEYLGRSAHFILVIFVLMCGAIGLFLFS